MPKIKVDASEAFCKKEGCKGPPIHRHHRGHEFLFVSVWTMGGQSRDEDIRKFIRRYWDFNEKDIVRICDRHHAEVHLDIDLIILEHRIKTKKMLEQYTFKEATDLVKRIQKYTDEWLTRETPGVKPEIVFGKTVTKFSQRKRHRVAARRFHDKKKEKNND
jgi:hypothetical protein